VLLISNNGLAGRVKFPHCPSYHRDTNLRHSQPFYQRRQMKAERDGDKTQQQTFHKQLYITYIADISQSSAPPNVQRKARDETVSFVITVLGLQPTQYYSNHY
jgi:hypothetical protein